MKRKKPLLIAAFFLISQSVMAFGLPTRYYPSKVIKKTIQVIAKKVGR
jgi:hypothetical protein